MAFVPPVPLIRRNLIIKRLKQSGTLSPGTAKTLKEAGVIHPDTFPRITEKLLARGAIRKMSDGKYYV